jgi:hypothetical protein
MFSRIAILSAALLVFRRLAAAGETSFLFRAPRFSRSQIAFEYGGYLSSMSREGGKAGQLMTVENESATKVEADRSALGALFSQLRTK